MIERAAQRYRQHLAPTLRSFIRWWWKELRDLLPARFVAPTSSRIEAQVTDRSIELSPIPSTLTLALRSIALDESVDASNRRGKEKTFINVPVPALRLNETKLG